MSPRPSRSIIAGVVALAIALVVMLAPGTASADPAGPTDYRSEILAVEPPTPSVELDVLGGDSFVELEAAAGTEVIVIGYQSEEYLWFRGDGTVFENRNAPSTYTNDDRFGGGEIPANASADAEPDWVEVATGGRYSWHDHRAHWMQTIRPAGRGVGDRIVEGVIPLVVDGDEVDVTVISTWEPEPSSSPLLLGIAVGLAVAAVSAWGWRQRRHWVAVAIPAALLAVVVGAWQFVSLPPETGPRLVWWVLPAIAVVAAVVGAVADLRSSPFVAGAAALVAGVQLAIWGVIKRDGLSAAIIPTDAPGWLDRLATTSALVAGTALTVFALLALFRPRGDVGRTPPTAVAGS